MHSFFAGIEGELSGNGFMSGALAGGVNEAAVALAQWGTQWNNDSEDFILNVVSNALSTALEKK